MPAADVVSVPAGLTRIASSRAVAHGKKDAGVDACGTDAWRPTRLEARVLSDETQMSAFAAKQPSQTGLLLPAYRHF
jgi:hypothetical protein